VTDSSENPVALDESVRVLHSAAWNGDISGRFKGYDY